MILRSLAFLFITALLSMPISAVAEYNTDSKNQQAANYVDQYVKNTLKVLDRDEIIVAKQLWHELMSAAGFDTDKLPGNQTWRDIPLTPAAKEIAIRRYFSKFSAPYLGDVFRAIAAPSVANPLVVGPAGVGKSFLTRQLTLILSFGIFPDYMNEELGIESDDPNAPFAAVREAVLGKTDVVKVNRAMLRANTGEKGTPFMDTDQRQAAAIEGLFDAARREFRRTDKEGRRTVFVFEEVATLDDDVQQILKTIAERSGVKNPRDPISRRQDVGYHIMGITTDDEKQSFAGGDGAIERRYRLVRLVEMTEAQGFELLVEKVGAEYEPQFSLKVSAEALHFIIHMRKFFDNPPQAMPGNIIKALEDLYTWSMHLRNRPAQGSNEIGLREAQNFLRDRLSLTNLWFEGPNGEPPLEGLSACVNDLVKGQEEVVDLIAGKIAAWARLGFSGEVPVFFLGGPSGSGKDTVFAAFNLCLFGHEGGAFQFDIAGQEGFGLTAIIKGPPLGNHSDKELPLLAQVLDQGLSSMIAMNEAQDIESGMMEQLKKFTETGEIHPQGQDKRMRKVYFPLFIMGQWGEHLFNETERKNYTNKPLRDETAITDTYADLTQADIDHAFMEGKRMFGRELIKETDTRYGKFGAVPYALLQRARMTGGVYVLRPVAVANYPKIIGLKINRLRRNIQKSNDIDLVVSQKLVQFIAHVAEHSTEGTRGLHSTTMDFTRRAISQAMSEGLPQRRVAVSLDYEERPEGIHLIIVRQLDADAVKNGTSPIPVIRQIELDARSLRSIKMTCEDTLISNTQREQLNALKFDSDGEPLLPEPIR